MIQTNLKLFGTYHNTECAAVQYAASHLHKWHTLLQRPTYIAAAYPSILASVPMARVKVQIHSFYDSAQQMGLSPLYW